LELKVALQHCFAAVAAAQQPHPQTRDQQVAAAAQCCCHQLLALPEVVAEVAGAERNCLRQSIQGRKTKARKIVDLVKSVAVLRKKCQVVWSKKGNDLATQFKPHASSSSQKTF
jgi:hypothetical protein